MPFALPGGGFPASASLTPLTAPPAFNEPPSASAESLLLSFDAQSSPARGPLWVLTFPVFCQSSAACLMAFHLVKAETCPSNDGEAEEPSLGPGKSSFFFLT